MMNLEAIDAATRLVLERGIRVFNGALFGPTEEEHVAFLLGAMDPPPGAMVIDAGCGVGEMARIMKMLRPDLEFLLLNASTAQLAQCPEELDLLHGDFNAMPLPDECADVVIFSYALCHSQDFERTFAEARRVLKVGGKVFVNDMARTMGDDTEFETVLGAQVHEAMEVEAWARAAGLGLDYTITPDVEVERLKDLLPEDGQHLLHGVVPTIWSFTALDDVAAAFGRHDRIAFQFSGGRDSTAALYLLRPYWDQMTVYHLDTGDQFPETRAVVEAVERDVPIVRILSDVASLRNLHGMPSDVVPVDNQEFGALVSGKVIKIQGRYDCCARALMFPMHDRMRADGITLLVRGQRDDEYASPPLRSGDATGGFEVLYPIQSWTGADVSAYLVERGLPIAQFYAKGVRRAPECMGCTAWWDEGRARYLREHYPQHHAVYMRRMADIKNEICQQLGWLHTEMEN
ncbi:2-methoxy-6-polyprenyl-1,4-benzoquinol methylase, mitochondrial [Comamonadaceae bacterium OS-1]|nr:2-methoxy-6-polyprenyl-1,4-benzoquinol methylase, mitochondrial [Comamonadaceae bacterium OS-1]